MPSKIIEISFTDELRQHVDDSSQLAAQSLNIDRQQDSPRHIIAAIDHWLREVCGQSAAKRRRPKFDIEETTLQLGCLWGEQLVRAFEWQWIRWSLSEQDDDSQLDADEHDEQAHQDQHEHIDGEGAADVGDFDDEDEGEAEDEDEVLIAVASPDRRLVIYPFHELYECLDGHAPVKLLLAFDVLSTPGRIPELPEGGYENVMVNVHHPS